MTFERPLDAVLIEACEAVGLAVDGAVLVHNYSNAIYHLPAEKAVARITAGPASIQRVSQTQAVARWLVDEHAFPATAPLRNAEPVQVSTGSVVSFWQYVQQPAAASFTSTDLAGLLRRLHDVPADELPGKALQWVPLVSLEAALAEGVDARLLAPEEVAWLQDHIATTRQQLSVVTWPLAPGLVHGDAWLGNLLIDETTGRIMLGDWDWTSIGPREIDLVPTWHATRRYGRDAAWTDAFAHTYGYDLAASPAFPALMRMRDLMQLTGPLRRAGADERYLHALRQRFTGIRSGDVTASWIGL